MSNSKTTSELLAELRAKEDLAIVRGLGSLAFVRGQGRTLEEKSQEKVLELLWAIVVNWKRLTLAMSSTAAIMPFAKRSPMKIVH
jgi:hypothetical protein